MIEAFLDLNAEGIQVLTNRAAGNEVVAENLRDSLKSILFQEAKKYFPVWNETDRDFEGFIADLVPAG